MTTSLHRALSRASYGFTWFTPRAVLWLTVFTVIKIKMVTGAAPPPGIVRLGLAGVQNKGYRPLRTLNTHKPKPFRVLLRRGGKMWLV